MEKPLPAYAGSDPFVFVCYAHADNALVYPEILRLQRSGFRIWYDDGITPGSEWTEAIAQAIETCQVFLYLITPNAVASEHCRREVNFALEQSCSMLAVHLAETNMPSALKLSLSHRQAILKYELPLERYESRLEKALSDAAAGNDDNGDDLTRALKMGEFVLDIASQRLLRGDESHLLDPKDMSVLLHLAEAAPGLVSTEELLTRSWPGSIVGDNVVHQVIGRLRKTFGESARSPSYIETLPRRGYRLLKDVQSYDAKPDPQPAGAPSLVVPDEPAPRTLAEPPVKSSAPRPLLGRRLMPIGVLVFLLAAVITSIYFWTERPVAPIHPRSIAVLPFTDLSVSGDLDRTSDDIVAYLSSALGRDNGFQLWGPSATLQYKNSDDDIQDIGEELGVAYLLTGTVLKDGTRIRVTMELVNVATLGQKWSDIKYDTASNALDTGRDIAIDAARDIIRSFQYDQPTLQVRQAEPTDAKRSLQDMFDKDPNAPSTTEFPSLEDVEVQSFDDFGDVE